MKLTATIIFCFFFSMSMYGQLQKSSQFYRKTGWLCNENILLDSTGLFFQDWGCENDVRVAYGRYVITKAGAVRLQYLSLNHLSPIAYMKQTEAVKDSILEVRLFDRNRKPVYSSFQVTFIDTAGRSERRGLDDSGLLLVNRYRYKEVFLDQLDFIFPGLPIPIIDDSIEIQFNFPRSFLSASKTSLGVGKRQTLYIKKDGLYKSERQRLYEIIE